jgi:hypothetical protein
MNVVVINDGFHLFCFQGQGFAKDGNDSNTGDILAKRKKEKVANG